MRVFLIVVLLLALTLPSDVIIEAFKSIVYSIDPEYADDIAFYGEDL